MKKQFVVSKYVMADSAAEAVRKAKHTPVHEVYIHGNWFDKVNNFEFNPPKEKSIGFNK